MGEQSLVRGRMATSIVQEVQIPTLPVECFAPLIGKRWTERMHAAIKQAQVLLSGRSVWNISSTATGGGVAEILQTYLAYERGAGINARWAVIQGDLEFFTITKRLHNGLHGGYGDGGPLAEHEHEHYFNILRRNAEDLCALVRPRDVVILHDPQTAGLILAMRQSGARVIWRCHVGQDTTNEAVEHAQKFLRPYLEAAHAFIFSRAAYVPSWLDSDRVHIIPPSIDAFSVKNQSMKPSTVHAIMASIGLLDISSGNKTLVRSGQLRTGPLADLRTDFTRQDGSLGRVHRRADIVYADRLPGPNVPIVVQVSRWDRLKDMIGVMHGFVDCIDGLGNAHLMLVGPNVQGVTDDPEGGEVLAECIAAWRNLPYAKRSRVHIVCLPMDDIEENAAMVNAIQRHAAVIVQKSLHEGFGLTVTEAMWKGRPIVASAVGGIQDQIVNGKHGLLVTDPTDLEAFGSALRRLLTDRALAQNLGRNARRRTIAHFLGSRQLVQHVDLFTAVEEGGPSLSWKEASPLNSNGNCSPFFERTSVPVV